MKCYVQRQRLYTVRQGSGSTTTLPPEVFTHRNFVADYKQILVEVGVFWCQETRVIYPFITYQNIGSMFFRFVKKHACDGQTDGEQNYDQLREQHICFVR